MPLKALKWKDAPEEMRQKHLLMVYSNGHGWTTEPPTEPGLYRIVRRDGTAEWSEYKGGALVWNTEMITHWLGPIPPPAPPETE